MSVLVLLLHYISERNIVLLLHYIHLKTLVTSYAVFTRTDVTPHFTIYFLCKTAASRHGAEKIHEAVAKDAKLQIQVALG